MSGPIRFVMVGGAVGEPAGEVCVDGVCAPLGEQPEYVDHDLGTGASGPADAGREAPSSGG